MDNQNPVIQSSFFVVVIVRIYSEWYLWVLKPRASCYCTGLDIASHYGDVIMGEMTSQINNLTIVYSSLYSGADQRKHQSFASLAFVRGIYRCPVNSPYKGPVTRKMFPFDDVIMTYNMWIGYLFPILGFHGLPDYNFWVPVSTKCHLPFISK